MTDALASVIDWLDERRAASNLSVRRVALEDCRSWSLDGGELRHSSGRYFQVVGARVSTGAYAGWCRPMIRQHEVGLLSFLVVERDGRAEWLVQAKTEPGNVGGTQLAPTVQATASNQERVHGGAATRFLDLFTGQAGGARHRVRSDLLASEQGTRFLGKRNRNMVVSIDPADAPPGEDAWRWVGAAAIRQLLARDFMVNADARSVIAAGPWSLLADASDPFATRASSRGFRGRLRRSYESGADTVPVLQELAARRAVAAPLVEELALAWEDGWLIEGCPEPMGDGLALFAVDVADREVSLWCQPLLTSRATEGCDLHTQVRGGVLRALFRFIAEPGLRNLVELGPTVQTDRGVTHGAPPGDASAIRLNVLQSDEGSRFLDCVVRYRIIEIRSGDAVTPPDGVWLSLSEIEALAAMSGVFSNEARSCISLLLSLA